MHSWEIEPNKDVKLFVGIPISPSFPFTHVLVEEAFDRAVKPPSIIKLYERAHGVAQAREKIVEKFLSTDATHLLMLDGDIVIQPNTIQKMLQTNKGVVLGRYMEASNVRAPEIFHHSQVPFRRDAPLDFKLHEILVYPKSDEDVILAGLGVIMLKRTIIEQLDRPVFLYSSEYGHLDDYWKVSEDFFFCLRIQDKVRQLKIENKDYTDFLIHYIPDIWCWHIGEAMVGDGGQVSFI